jgi:hypothetical protein
MERDSEDKVLRFYFDLNNHKIEHLINKIKSEDPRYSLEKMVSKGLDENKKIEIERILIGDIDTGNRKKFVINYCNQIASNAKGLDEIKKDIINSIIDISEIENFIHESNLTPDLLQKIKYYNSFKKKIDFHLWSNLPPLLDNHTDIYFFGQPQSGKSCILANLFSFINENGLFIQNSHCKVGNIYKDIIYDEYNKGFLPERTESKINDGFGTITDGVNYITFDLINPSKRNQKHPLNFIEMSGELFDDAYGDGEVSENNLNAKNYLNNNNRKLLFFVLDYDKHVKNELNPMGETPQGAKMTAILSLLEKFGTFKKTDGIYILVSKADLFDAGNLEQAAEDFIYDNYKSFIQNCIDIQENNSSEFKIKIYPYSIGNLTMQSTYVYERDYTWSEKIVKEIISKSFYKRPPVWGRFFKLLF